MRAYCNSHHSRRLWGDCPDCGQSKFQLDSESEFITVNRAPGRDTVILYCTGPMSDYFDMRNALYGFGVANFGDSVCVVKGETWQEANVRVHVVFYLKTQDPRYPHPNPEV